MTMPMGTVNRRILVIDDTESIHEDFRKILSAGADSPSALASAEAALFGDAPTLRATFDLDSAYQGEEGLAMVASARAEGNPYAMAFIDMRMPPGWDGVETVERLWEVDPALQVALCTAFSDYSLEEMEDRLELGDRLLILKKPFDAIEIRQLASALTMKWQMTKEAALKMSALEQAVEERTKELSDANIIVQNSPTILYRLRAEPSFPLMYISHNITKFGHVAAQLVASPNWARDLINPDDQEKVDAAMARVLEKDAEGASIEFRMRTGDGAYRWVENRYVPVRNKSGLLVEVEGIILDITERKVAEEKISLLARTDGLTGLANRATLLERLSQTYAATQRGASAFAVLYLDIDHFKAVNDTLGHAVGDLLLQEVSARIKSCTRAIDVIARLGGDEFAVLLNDAADAQTALARCQTLCDAIAEPYTLEVNGSRLAVTIGASIGVTLFIPGDAYDRIVAAADSAMYDAKRSGKNRCVLG